MSQNQTQKALRELQRKSIDVLTAAGYKCTLWPQAAIFNIIGINPSDIVLVQISVNEWPDDSELKAIKSFPAPRNTRRLIHKWRNYARTPEVREVR